MQKAINLINSFNLNKQQAIITSVSGGLDSMALLYFLIENNFNPIVVHFNHNTRQTNKRDEQLITSFCEKHNLKYYIESINVTSGNFQSEARDLRYDALEKIAHLNNTKIIATAHHLDDLAETVLIKLTRGSNLYGYSGIQEYYNKNGFYYLRPFLQLSKSEIKDYINKHSIPYFDDESNYTDTYLRNRYRHTVIPLLKQDNPSFLNKVSNYHEQLLQAAKYIEKVAKTYIIDSVVDVTTFKTLDLVIQNEIISCLFHEKKIEFTFNTLETIRSILLNESSNNSYNLKNNYEFIKTYNKAFINSTVEPVNFDVLLNNLSNNLPNMKKITFSNTISKINSNTFEIWYNKLSLPLRARTRKPGDKLAFKYGHKKLKDYLIDAKIPPILRKDVWLLTDSNDTILWVSTGYVNETLGNKNKIIFLVGENVDE